MGSRHGVTVPAAYREWAALGGGQILHNHNPDDMQWFDQCNYWNGSKDPGIITTPDGSRGIPYQQERHDGAYHTIVLLDHGDDPPVLFCWDSPSFITEEPWVVDGPQVVVRAPRFSDCVYAEVFDHQFGDYYYLDPDDPDDRLRGFDPREEWVGPYATDGCLGYLRSHYEETVSTRRFTDDGPVEEYRFARSPTERLIVDVGSEGVTAGAVVRVTAATRDQIVAMEAELRTNLADTVLLGG